MVKPGMEMWSMVEYAFCMAMKLCFADWERADEETTAKLYSGLHFF
jgi:hypothetical protein